MTSTTNEIVIHCPTIEDWDKVISCAIERGNEWDNGNIKIYRDYWYINREISCIRIRDNTMYWGIKTFYEEEGFKIISADEYLGEVTGYYQIGVDYMATKQDYSSLAQTISNHLRTRPWSIGPGDIIPGSWILGGEINLSCKPNKTMSVIKNAFKSTKRKALEFFDIVDGDGGLTDTGRVEFVDYLYETNKELRKGFEDKIVEAYKKLK